MKFPKRRVQRGEMEKNLKSLFQGHSVRSKKWSNLDIG